MTDISTAISYINWQGGLMVCNNVTKNIWEFCIKKGDIFQQHIHLGKIIP